MGLLTTFVTLPAAPLRGVLALSRLLQEQAEQKLYDPTQVRRQIDEIEAARARGDLPDEAAEELQQQALDRLLGR